MFEEFQEKMSKIFIEIREFFLLGKEKSAEWLIVWIRKRFFVNVMKMEETLWNVSYTNHNLQIDRLNLRSTFIPSSIRNEKISTVLSINSNFIELLEFVSDLWRNRKMN